MSENETKYYLIWDYQVGKTEEGRDYLFKDGQWVPDTKCVIMDHLHGYDPSEPPGSPYGFGDSSIRDEIQRITKEEVDARIN